MSTKDDALALVRALPDDCTWRDIARAVAERAGDEAPGGSWRVAELRAEYGPAEAVHPDAEAEVRSFDVVIERDAEGLFVGSVPALQGCHTQAPTLDALHERIREAIELCLEAGGGRTTGTELVGVRRISIPA